MSDGGVWSVQRSLGERAEAVSLARRLFAKGRYEAVKVVRYRRRRSGFLYETVILHDAIPQFEQRLRMSPSALPDNAFVACTEAGDLYRLETRRLIGHLFRSFLEAHAITPTELLHGLQHYRRLADTQGLLGAALQQIAVGQARKLGLSVRERLAQLQLLVTQAEARARRAAVLTAALPRLGVANLDRVSAAVLARVGPEEHAHVLMTLLTDHLSQLSSMSRKLERLLGMLSVTEDADAAILVEGVLADLLQFGEPLRDLFGQLPSLAALILALADVLHGRLNAPSVTGNTKLQAVTLLIRGGRAPACAAVLLERLLSELDSTKPLDPHEPDQEETLLREIIQRMKDEQGVLLGGVRAEHAIAFRQMLLRQRYLRNMGMHDVADALPRTWRPVIL